MDTPIVPQKRCSKCNEWFPETAEFFHNDNRSKSGFRADCKTCHNAKSGQYYQRNRDRALSVAREYRESHRDQTRTYFNQYNLAHREERRQYAVQYRIDHPGTWRKYLLNARIYCARRRARKRSISGGYTRADIRLQIRSQTDKRGHLHCWWCGKIIKGNDYHVDHITPLDKGGSNAPENLCIACPPCNLSKSNKLPSEWAGRLL